MRRVQPSSRDFGRPIRGFSRSGLRVCIRTRVGATPSKGCRWSHSTGCCALHAITASGFWTKMPSTIASIRMSREGLENAEQELEPRLVAEEGPREGCAGYVPEGL